jgi:hypothetical protein
MRRLLTTAKCIIIDHFSAFESGLVAPFLTLRDKHGWVRPKTARNLNIGVSRNSFCDFLADPGSRSFSRFGAIIMQFAVCVDHARSHVAAGSHARPLSFLPTSTYGRTYAVALSSASARLASGPAALHYWVAASSCLVVPASFVVLYCRVALPQWLWVRVRCVKNTASAHSDRPSSIRL